MKKSKVMETRYPYNLYFDVMGITDVEKSDDINNFMKFYKDSVKKSGWLLYTDARIIKLRYEMKLSILDISEIYEVTETRIDRLIKSILRRLRKYYTNSAEDVKMLTLTKDTKVSEKYIESENVKKKPDKILHLIDDRIDLWLKNSIDSIGLPSIILKCVESIGGVYTVEDFIEYFIKCTDVLTNGSSMNVIKKGTIFPTPDSKNASIIVRHGYLNIHGFGIKRYKILYETLHLDLIEKFICVDKIYEEVSVESSENNIPENDVMNSSYVELDEYDIIVNTNDPKSIIQLESIRYGISNSVINEIINSLFDDQSDFEINLLKNELFKICKGFNEYQNILLNLVFEYKFNYKTIGEKFYELLGSPKELSSCHIEERVNEIINMIKVKIFIDDSGFQDIDMITYSSLKNQKLMFSFLSSYIGNFNIIKNTVDSLKLINVYTVGDLISVAMMNVKAQETRILFPNQIELTSCDCYKNFYNKICEVMGTIEYANIYYALRLRILNAFIRNNGLQWMIVDCSTDILMDELFENTKVSISEDKIISAINVLQINFPITMDCIRLKYILLCSREFMRGYFYDRLHLSNIKISAIYDIKYSITLGKLLIKSYIMNNGYLNIEKFSDEIHIKMRNMPQPYKNEINITIENFYIYSLWECRGGELFPEPDDPLLPWLLYYAVQSIDIDGYTKLYPKLCKLNKIFVMPSSSVWEDFRKSLIKEREKWF